MKPIAAPRYSEASAPPQISRLLLQHVATLGRDPALPCHSLGLAVGSRQTAVSWGLLASPPLGEALDLAIRYQRHTGALLDYEMERRDGRCQVFASTRFFDPEVAVFYLEKPSPAPRPSTVTCPARTYVKRIQLRLLS